MTDRSPRDVPLRVSGRNDGNDRDPDTDSEAQTQQRITAEVERIAQSRETIDQAKGMLMAVYGLDGDAAFRVLRGWSQTSNTRLHTLAEQLVADFTALGARPELPPRKAYQDAISDIHIRCRQASSDC